MQTKNVMIVKNLASFMALYRGRSMWLIPKRLVGIETSGALGTTFRQAYQEIGCKLIDVPLPAPESGQNLLVSHQKSTKSRYFSPWFWFPIILRGEKGIQWESETVPAAVKCRQKFLHQSTVLIDGKEQKTDTSQKTCLNQQHPGFRVKSTDRIDYPFSDRISCPRSGDWLPVWFLDIRSCKV